MPGGDEEFRHTPYVLVGGHPMLVVESGEVDGSRVGAKGAFATKVVVVVEVAEGKFARSAVDGGTKAEAGEVGFGDAAPEAVVAVDSQNVVVVVNGFEVYEKRWIAVDTEGCGGNESAFKAVAFALAEDALRRQGRIGVLIWDFVDELLNFRRGV